MAKVIDTDLGFDKILGNISKVTKKQAMTGYFQDDIEDGIGLAQLMATHEFGSDERNIPERPAMRLAFENSNEDLANFMFEIADKMIFESLGVDLGYQVMGDFYKDEFQNGVASRSLGLEPNAPRTITRKKSDNPLIDTARLVNGINTRVEDK